MLMPRLHVFAGKHSEASILSSQKVFQLWIFCQPVIGWVIDEGAHVRFSQISSGGHPEGWHFDACPSSPQERDLPFILSP